MLRNIHAVAGGGRVFWEYLCLAVAAASLQAAAVLVLFPLLGELFSDHPVTAGTWVLVFLGIIALAWGADILTARRGLRLGIGIMRGYRAARTGGGPGLAGLEAHPRQNCGSAQPHG